MAHIITLNVLGKDVEYVLYCRVESDGRRYALLILKEVMLQLADCMAERSQVILSLTLFEVRGESYIRIDDEKEKERLYDRAAANGFK
jgi:hypothetical protein